MFALKRPNQFVIAALIPLLTGCGVFGPSKPTAKTCGTDETALALKQVIFSNAKSPLASEAILQELAQKTEVSIENATASDIDEELGKVDCAGQIAVRFPSDLHSPFLSKGGVSRQINFSIQMAADQKSLVYSIYDGDQLVSAIAFAGMMLQSSKQEAAAAPMPSTSSEPSEPDSATETPSNDEGSKGSDRLADKSCDELWHERNAIFAKNGFCFKSAKAISEFGKGCFAPFGKLKGQDKSLVDQIAALETQKQCVAGNKD